jgi:hypothetical protein
VVRLRRFWVENESGQTAAAVPSGSRATLAFQYEASGPLGEVSLGFSLHTADEKPLTILYSDYQGHSFGRLPAAGVLRFAFARLPLSAGSYLVSARMLVNGNEADWPRDYVGRLEVDGGDFYGVRQPYHSGQGSIWLEGGWACSAVPATVQ